MPDWCRVVEVAVDGVVVCEVEVCFVGKRQDRIACERIGAALVEAGGSLVVQLRV